MVITNIIELHVLVKMGILKPKKVVPSGVEPLSLGPGPKRIAATLRDYENIQMFE